MTGSIWKFELNIGGGASGVDRQSVHSVRMPTGAEVLSVQTQRETPCIWALVNPDAPPENRRFEVYGTGQPINLSRPLKPLGTVQMMGGYLIFHVFEVIGGSE